MKLIEKFYCIQTEKYGDGSEKVIAEGIAQIKQELIRPSIQFINSNGDIISSESRVTHVKRLIANPYVKTNEYFSKEELLFLSKTYQFEVQESPEYEGYFTSIMKSNPLYKSSANIILIEENKKEYLIIEYNRWKLEDQPRSAGEDQLGEDVTYILGIWENPLLTDEIIAKIKNKR